jgi:alpha-L-fucosidase
MNLDYLANIRPSHRQLEWQRMEMYAFIHFGMPTMIDKEWGLGHEDEALFSPESVDVEQWMDVIESAGMTGVILTCKHHDGFCLWPSAYTTHTVASSPWKGGKGDLVLDVSKAAARRGLKFGVYLSPWDRTEETYGTGGPYNDFYNNQLIELLTHYGPIFSVWLDGACGEGANGKRQEYDWQRIYNTVRALQPEAVISICGPDVRWCGNEAGQARKNEWSVVPERLRLAELTAAKSQKVDDGKFSRSVRSDDEDLGSREVLGDSDIPLAWYPAEVDTSIRPGFFYHASEDDKVRSPEELFDIWKTSVGGNANLILNFPITPQGQIFPTDATAAAGFGDMLRDFKSRFITGGVAVEFSSNPLGTTSMDILSTDPEGRYWTPSPSDSTPTVTLAFTEPRRIEAVVLREQICEGQRIEGVEVIGQSGDDVRELASCESVGYQRILEFRPTQVDRLSVRITGSRLVPTLASIVAVEGK